MPRDSPTAGTAPAAPVSALQELSVRRAELEAELHEFEDRLASGTLSSVEFSKLVSNVQRIELLFVQQSAALQQFEELEKARTVVQQELAAIEARGISDKPPFSVMIVDERLDELDQETGRASSIEASIRAAEDAVVQARERAQDAEQTRRQAKEAVDTNADPARSAGLAFTLKLKQLESRAAQERVRLREAELTNEKLAEEIQKLRVTLYSRGVAIVTSDICFTRGELQQQIEQIDRDTAALTEALGAATRELESVERQWTKASARLEKHPDDQILTDEIEAKRLIRQTRQREVTLLGQRLQIIGDVKTAWTRRHQIVNSTFDRGDLDRWEREVAEAIAQLEREGRLDPARFSEMRDEFGSLSERATTAIAVTPDRAKWLNEQVRTLQERMKSFEHYVADRENLHRLQQRLSHEIASKSSTFSLRERIAVLWQLRGTVWRYEIFAIDDQSITVGKIVSGIILFVLGLIVSRVLSRLLGQRILPRIGLDPGASSALQSLSFYFFLLVVSLLALRVLHIPLTIFTLAGGAIAIGVGFGSQNIINNFISGLILLTERPIRVGDLIQVDGTFGIVERIGPRSTRVLSSTNIHIVVPNSAFLEKNVINWTLSDSTVRTHVNVGAPYGASARFIEAMLLQAVREHSSVLQTPPPTVLFENYGDNSLAFEVHFWIRIRTSFERRIIESDIRYRIEELFTTNNISMPFPQRDVHLNVNRPLEIRVLPTAPEDQES